MLCNILFILPDIKKKKKQQQQKNKTKTKKNKQKNGPYNIINHQMLLPVAFEPAHEIMVRIT